MGKEQAYRSTYNSSLLGFNRAPANSFADALRSSDFFPNQSSDNTLVYSFQTPPIDVVSGVAQEVQRLSSMLIETLIAIDNTKQRKSIAWKMVKFYYAAFFSAQLIGRLTNNWLGRLVGLEDFDSLLQLHHGKNLSLPKKTKGFLCNFDGTHSINCLPIEADDGSHILVWKIFALGIDRLILDLRSVRPQQNDVAEVIGDLSKLQIDLGTPPTFLTTFRNETNYRMGNGVWFPQSQNASKEWDLYFNLMSIERSISTPPSYIQRHNSKNQKFLACCTFIIHLALWIINDYSKSNPKNKYLKGNTSRIEISLAE
ncbi:hypothetical protein [Bdellovibrio bacteriovorus]|uniref:hypothetical protein n=1 Tax=Bdellovibrio bacteriovorus TaxID=959 RepID=UPI003D0932B5